MVCLFRSKLLSNKKKRKKNQKVVRRPSLYIPPAAPPRSLTPCVTSSETEYTLYLEAVASRPINSGRSTSSVDWKLKYSLRQLASAHAHTRSKNQLLVHHTCLFGGGQWNCYISCPGVGSLLRQKATYRVSSVEIEIFTHPSSINSCTYAEQNPASGVSCLPLWWWALELLHQLKSGRCCYAQGFCSIVASRWREGHACLSSIAVRIFTFIH